MPKSSPLIDSPPPLFTLVGMPNVGKSTLFNILARPQRTTHALTGDMAGLTRDVRIAQLDGYRLADTAGYPSHQDALAQQAWRNTQDLLAQSDGIILMVDGRHPLSAGDDFIIRHVRKLNRPFIAIANKCEGKRPMEGLRELETQGFEEVLAISCSHRDGIHDIQLWLEQHSQSEGHENTTTPFVIAIIGKPNVGKSTLTNCLLGQEAMLTSETPHTTRDSVAHYVPLTLDDDNYDNQCLLYDTAGLARHKHAKNSLAMSRHQALDAIKRAHLALLVLDGSVAPSKQDFSLASLAIRHNTTPLLLLNKWDLLSKNERAHSLSQFEDITAKRLAQLGKARILGISAQKKTGMRELRHLIRLTQTDLQKTIATPTLNQWLGAKLNDQAPPRAKKGELKIRYVTQTAQNPPQFTFFVNKPLELRQSYRRYLANHLRQEFALEGILIRLMWRKSMTPWKKRL